MTAIATTPSSKSQLKQTNSTWLFNPLVDLSFVCGGLVWLLFGIHYLVAPHAYQAGPHVEDIIPLLGVMGTILLGDTHIAATLLQLYGDGATRNKHPWLAYVAPLAALTLGVTALISPTVMSFAARAYLVVIVHHVMAQTYGIALMYCRKQNYQLSGFEQKVLQVCIQTCTLYAVLSQFVYPDNFRHSFFGIQLPIFAPIPSWIWAVSLALAFCYLSALSAIVLRKAITEHRLPPAPAALLLATGLFIPAVAVHASGVLSLYIPAFFHGLQYLALSIHKRLNQPDNAASSNNSRTLDYYGLSLLATTFLLFALIPQLLTIATGISFSATFFAVFLCINSHHILVDSYIWKRKPVGMQVIAS